jgi:hypothetical protein
MRVASLALILVLGNPAVGVAQDTVVVKADNQPLWGSNVRLTRDLRIGVVDGPEERSFGRISGVAVASDGDIWVADAQTATIRRFAADGRYLGSVGRRGEGPGEFRDLAGLQRMPDGRFAAWDAPLARISFFDSAGSYLSLVRVPISLIAGGDSEPFRVDDESRSYVFSATATRLSIQPFYLRLDVTGQADTIRIPDADVDGPRFGGRSYSVGMMHPFSIVTKSALSPAGHLVTARNERYILNTRSADDRPLRIERSFTPVRVQAAERRERQRLGDHFRGRNSNARETSAAVPRQKPPFWALWVDQDARIWVARHGPRCPHARNSGRTRATGALSESAR